MKRFGTPDHDGKQRELEVAQLQLIREQLMRRKAVNGTQ